MPRALYGDLLRAGYRQRVHVACELYTQSSGELRQDLLRGIKLVKLCQEMGIDETSVSNVLQWLLVLKDMRVIEDSHLDGVPLAWGDVDSQVEFTRNMIHREGVGDVFADGLLAAAKHLDAHTAPGPRAGQSTYYYAMQVTTAPCTASTRASSRWRSRTPSAGGRTASRISTCRISTS